MGVVIGLTTLSLMIPSLAAPPVASATTSGSQSDPAADFGRGGVEVPGQPACYLGSGDITRRRMWSQTRPSCFPGHME